MKRRKDLCGHRFVRKIIHLQVKECVLRKDRKDEEDKLKMLKLSNPKEEAEGSEPESAPSKQREEEDSTKLDFGPQPLDGGWGWAVVLGASLIAALVPTLAPSFGVLFAPQLLQWGASSTTVAVLFNAYVMMWMGTGVVAPTLSKEFGFRRVAMTGTLLTACCLSVSAFASSPEFLFITFSLGCGVGSGLSSTGFLVVSQYFKRRLGLAQAIHTSGLGVGRFLCPLLIQLLQETYGHRGATLLHGGVVLHAFIGATLFHPLHWHAPPRQHQTPLLSYAPPSGLRVRVASRPRCLSEGDTSFVVDLRPCHQSSHSLEFDRTSRRSAASLDPATLASMTLPDTQASKAVTEPGQEAPQTRRRVWQTVTRMWDALLRDLAILRRPHALTIALSHMLVTSAHHNFTSLLPFAMRAAGHSLHTAAWFLSLIGVANLVCRMLTSTLSDYAWFNIRLCGLLSLVTMAAAVTVFSFQSGVAGTAAVAGVWGVTLGTYQGVNHLYMLRMVGVQKLPSMWGSMNLVVAFAFITVGPLLGVLRDVTESYAVTSWVTGGLITVSSILWFLIPTAAAYDRRREEEEGMQGDSSA